MKKYNTICVNLPEDTTRKQFMQKQFDNLSLDVEYIYSPRPHEGYGSSNYQFAGEQGVLRSQLKGITTFIESEIPLLIFEDDVHIDENTVSKIDYFLNQQIEDWGILYLGGAPKAKLRETNYKNISIVSEFTQACGYMLNHKVLKNFVIFCFDRMGLPFPNACYDNMLNDYFLHQENLTMYAFDPPLVYQVAGYSTLRKGHRDYVEFIRKQWEIYKK
jgi:GR25 family glycosyltransferase involved in LPS biosynthesis